MARTRTTWKPGQSGNPKGRPPRGYSITEMMKEMLGSNPEIKRALGKVIIRKALEGDMAAINRVWAYMDGLPTQPINTSGVTEIVITREPVDKKE